MAKLNTVELMNGFNTLNMNVKDFSDMKKVSTLTFYNHKHIYESNEFIDITNLTKITYDNIMYAYHYFKNDLIKLLDRNYI